MKLLTEELRRRTSLSVKLPADIGFRRDGDVVTMALGERQMGLNGGCNMQSDGAAFEAWALALHCLGVRVKLVSCHDLPKPLLGAGGHYMRFLYRVGKFLDFYGDWFAVDSALCGRVGEFREFIASHEFCNSLPNGVAGNKEQAESIVESAFAAHPEKLWKISDMGCVSVYRQLPVGLFCGKPSEKTAVFTHKKSAIDLWAADGDILRIFELKTRNKMAGIVTELMFYCNYVNDMYIADNTLHPLKCVGSGERLRGYDKLIEHSYKTVRGYMLVDELHPIVTEELLAEMNRVSARSNVIYDTILYGRDEVTHGD